MIFQFPINSSWQDCRLRVGFKSPTVEALCCIQSPPQMRNGRNVEPPLEDIWRADHREIFGPVHVSRDQTQLLMQRPRRDVINFAHFIIPRPVAPLTQNFCDRYHGKPFCGHVCAGETLQWVYWKGRHVAITTPEKERLCFALSLFLSDRCARCVWSLSATKSRNFERIWMILLGTRSFQPQSHRSVN